MSNLIADTTQTTLQFILGALALVVALAWNEAFKLWFENDKSLQQNGPWVYALSVTGIAVGVGIALSRAQARLAKMGAKVIIK